MFALCAVVALTFLCPSPAQPSAATVEVLSPTDGEVVSVPVTFKFATGNGVKTVALFVDDIPLSPAPLPADLGTYTAGFNGVNMVRHLVLEGYAENGRLLATDELDFVPSKGYVVLPDGFNRYVIQAVNDWTRFPKNGAYPYCWRDCPGSMGLIHPVSYLGETLWDGSATCFCTGHTLEIFLAAVRSWQAANGLDESEPFGDLSLDSVQGGEFYQYWQGYGVTFQASSADAFASTDIGYAVGPDAWRTALPGDFVNLSRINGTGHSAIFISWITQHGEIAGLRYYGCNSSGSSHPDPTDPAGTTRVSGPSFVTEMLVGFGGTVIPEYLFIGHVVDPLLGY